MTFKCKSIYLWLFIMVALQGCSLSSIDKEKLPGIDVKSDKTNTNFLVFEDPVGGSANTHKNNEFLAITVKNLVESQIEFSAGFVSLFAQTDDGWMKIDNLMNRPDTAVRLPTTKEFPPGMVVTVVPWIPDLKEPRKVRIFFEGQNVDTGEKVGAHMDFTLLP